MTPDAAANASAVPGTGPATHPDPVTVTAARQIRARFPDAIVEEVTGGRHPYLRIKASRVLEVAMLVRDDPALQMDCCHLISGVDWPAKTTAATPAATPAVTPADGAGTIDVVYHLVSYARRPDPVYRKASPKNDAFLVLKVAVPRDKAEVASVMNVWAGADWHERETYDLMGVVFTGRGRLTRILLPEDWPGHPLRKDWEYPADYHGIPIIPPEGR